MKQLPKIDKPVLIIGGGPSLKGVDLTKIDRNKYFVIGLNFAYKLLEPDLLHFADGPFFIMSCRDMLKAKYPKTTCGHWLDWLDMYSAKNYWEKVDVHYLPNLTRDEGLDLDEAEQLCGNNSGHQAINLAIRLGAKEIYLLGYDMKVGNKGESEWHNEAPAEKTAMEQQIELWIPRLERLKPLVDELGVKVYNCNPDSGLRCFDFYDVEKL